MTPSDVAINACDVTMTASNVVEEVLEGEVAEAGG